MVSQYIGTYSFNECLILQGNYSLKGGSEQRVGARISVNLIEIAAFY